MRKIGTIDPKNLVKSSKIYYVVVKSSKIVGSANRKDTDWPKKEQKIDHRVSSWKNVF